MENKDPYEIECHTVLQYIIITFNLFCEIKNLQNFFAVNLL
jgi:hypothetical protein